jgi:hypothetical protein
LIIWLASYPRSGNTLLRTIIKRCFGLNSYADEPIHVESAIRSDNGLIGHQELPTPWAEFYEMASNASETYLVKTHLPPRDDQPYLYVVRDGRSAVRSYLKYYERYVPGHHPSLYEIIAGDDAYGDWSSHYAAWVKRAGVPGITVRFEELTQVSEELLASLADAIRYRGTMASWENPFGALAKVEPGFFREGTNEFDPGSDWPQLANVLFEFLHSGLLAELGYERLGQSDISAEWAALFNWNRSLVARNHALQAACDERLALIDRLSLEAQRRLEIINSMVQK